MSKALPPQKICRGDSVIIPFSFTLDCYRYVITVPALVTPPAVGTRYKYKNRFFMVASVLGSEIKLNSNSGVDILPQVGTLIKTVGVGDQFLTYTSRESNIYANITGMTLKFRVIRSIVDNPSGVDVIIPTKMITNHSDPENGQTAVPITMSESINYEIGKFIGVVELSTGSSFIAEQNNENTFTFEIQANKA